jgi:hypothetical protein
MGPRRFDGNSAAVLAYPSDRNEPVRIVETTFSYTQSTCSPRVITFSPHSVHFQSLSVHFQPHVDPRSVHVGVHVRGSPCPGTPGNLWRSTPDGGNHVELCDRHVETRGPKGIRIHWGVPTFHGAASQTPRRGIPGGGFLVSGVSGREKSRLGSPPSWGSRGRTSERSGPGVPRHLQSAGRPQGRDPIQSLAATLSYMQSTYVATCSPRTWIHVDPVAFNVEWGSEGHGGRGWVGHGRGSGRHSATG